MFMARYFKYQRNYNHNLILFILVIHTFLNSNSVFLFQVGDRSRGFSEKITLVK